MFTRNWYIATVGQSAYTTDTYSVDKTVFKNLRTPSNAAPSLFSNTASSLMTTIYCPKECWGVANMRGLRTTYATYGGAVLGTGTTPPSLDDYRLSGDMITDFNYTSTVSIEEVDGGVEYTAVYTITNAGADEFTIGEIGLFGTTYGSSSASYAVLIERTVLDEPVTIPAGGVGQVTYTIRMEYPTA